MKKTILKAFSLALIASTLITSCKDDTVEIVIPGGENNSEVIENLNNGILNGTLDQDVTLNSNTVYELTSSFVVPDGYELTIPAGTKILADDGGTDVYIAVLQGGKININGTESDPVIISTDDGEPGGWGGLTICGKATSTAGTNVEAEVGGFIYGGSDDTDNSGTIEYLQITGTGAQINSESQYNGISFYSVGSGTTVNNIAVINGDDDGVEFFGGTVSVENLYVENASDDAVDWTEGWSGGITNTYISHTVAGFSTAFEGDKDNGNPTFTNVTAISTQGGTALQFKSVSGGTITGLSLVGYDIDIDMAGDGALSNVQIDGADADGTLVDGSTNEYTISTTSEPTVDSSLFDWIDSDVSFETVILSGNVTSNVTLDASVNYILTASYVVQDGASLTIPAGTKISADAGGTDVYIAVLQGGKIYINGTASEPVVISSANAEPGDWGGLTICGKASSTAGTNVEAEVGGFIYGGSVDTDNSGTIEYLVLKGTGAQINSESQYNGLSLYSVGSATTINNIAVINGDDDGVEFFGGTVSVTNLYLENNSDDSIDWTEGWSGGVTNTYISHTVAGFSTAFEGDKDNGNPTFTNVTAISTQGGTALQFKSVSGGSITGLYLEGYDIDIDMAGDGALSNVQINGADADGTLVSGSTNEYTLNSGKDSNKVDISSWSWIDATL